MYTFPVNEIEGQNFHTFHTEIYQRVLTIFIEISNNVPRVQVRGVVVVLTPFQNALLRSLVAYRSTHIPFLGFSVKRRFKRTYLQSCVINR